MYFLPTSCWTGNDTTKFQLAGLFFPEEFTSCLSNGMRCKSKYKRGEMLGLQVLSRNAVFTSHLFFTTFPFFALLLSGHTYRACSPWCLNQILPQSLTAAFQTGLSRTSGWPEPGRAGRRWSCRRAQQRGSAAPWWGSPTAPSSWACTHTAATLPTGFCCLRRAGLVWRVGQSDTCLDRKSTEMGGPGEQVRLCWLQCQVGSSALRDGGFFDVSSPFVDTACTPSWRHWKSWQLLWSSLHWEQTETVFLQGCFMRSGKRAPGQSTKD